MIKILICEDIERDKLHLHQLLDSFLFSYKISYKIDCIENFDVGSNLFLEYDLIFLDIELGDYNGIEIASKIRTYNRSSIIIITSSFKKYLIDGYTNLEYGSIFSLHGNNFSSWNIASVLWL